MRVKILSQVIEELNRDSEVELFGIQDKESVIISSLKSAPRLEKVGVYCATSKEENEKLVFRFVEGSLACFSQQDGKSKKIQVEVIDYATDFQKRNKGIIEESVLQERTVLIIGLGSGGSAIALDLVRCGVTNLILIDFDEVSLSNLCRSVYDLHDVGKDKTDAIYQKLLSINPCANIELRKEDVFEMRRKELLEVIEKSDLIIEATDSVKTKVLINGLAHSLKPVFYPAVYDSGKGGDILFTLPGFPCYECVFSSIIGEMKEEKKADWDYTTDHAKPMPALICDIQVVVARTVKLALGILLGDREDSFIEKITELDSSILFISNERGTAGSKKPFDEFWSETRINPECSCQLLE